jgi:dihydroflavonol-4-reductase
MLTAVTGASGHIGGNLVRELLKRGRTVRAVIGKDDRAVRGLGIEVLSADIADINSLTRALKGADSVFHLAGVISVDGDKDGSVRKANVAGVENVIKACVECGTGKLVHFSSIHAYSSFPVEEEIDETRCLALSEDCHAYDRSKAEGQELVRKACAGGLNAVIVNPTGVIGPFDFKPSRMGSFFLDIYHGKFPALVDGGYNWVDARDVSIGAILAEEKGKCGESYILGGNWAHICEVADLISKFTGRKVPKIATPMWLAGIAAKIAYKFPTISGKKRKFTPESIDTLDSHKYISSKKAELELGYSCRPLEETIKDTFAWFEKNGMLDSRKQNGR